MILAQLQLFGRTHHAVRGDAANFRDFQLKTTARHKRARRAEHADQPGAGIGRAAHYLHRPVTRINRQHLQLVRLWVTRSAQHARDPERGKRGTGVLQSLHFQPDTGEREDDVVKARVRLQMLFQPAQGEFHAPTPPLKVGTSSTPKP